MMLARRGIGRQFVDNAIKLDDSKKSPIFLNALHRTVSQALVLRSGLDYRLAQQLYSKFFPNTGAPKHLLAQRMTNESKRED